MDDTDRNSIAMLKTVRSYMTNHAVALQPVKAIALAMTEVGTMVDEINGIVLRQEAPTGGITEDKEALRDALEEITLVVADAVQAYANSINDHTLAADVTLTLSELDRMAEERLNDAATRVYTAATAVMGSLGNHGVDQTKLDALETARVAFGGDQAKPRVKIAEKAGETSILKPKIRAAKSILRQQVDKLMTAFKKSDPQVYAGYLSARVIIDRHDPGSAGDTPPPTPPPTP